MSVKDISRDLKKLDAQLDSLEEALAPLLTNVTELSSQLPLLDRSKLMVLQNYALETVLFAGLKLEGTDATKHPVFTELKRTKQFLEKIENVEKKNEAKATDGERSTVNVEAAARFIRSDLSDNKEIRSKLTEQIAKEKAKALLKSLDQDQA